MLVVKVSGGYAASQENPCSLSPRSRLPSLLMHCDESGSGSYKTANEKTHVLSNFTHRLKEEVMLCTVVRLSR